LFQRHHVARAPLAYAYKPCDPPDCAFRCASRMRRRALSGTSASATLRQLRRPRARLVTTHAWPALQHRAAVRSHCVHLATHRRVTCASSCVLPCRCAVCCGASRTAHTRTPHTLLLLTLDTWCRALLLTLRAAVCTCLGCTCVSCARRAHGAWVAEMATRASAGVTEVTGVARASVSLRVLLCPRALACRGGA
jgi:hypothetical protein